MGTMRVSTTVRRDDLAVVAAAREYELIMDQSKKNGGLENTMKPMEVLLAALGGCITMVARGQAPIKGVEIRDISLHIEGEYDADGFSAIAILARVASSSPKKAVEEFLHYVESVCPVSNSLKAKMSMEVVLE